ncbi:hypothetical protein RFI_25984 [Reticulomyxa filosa]|uniref:Uncharacterized protein n=1 Tax=Reticulomyxa filosa TaxID=46433 RepID=X6MDA8_RETFI|nr:hypothetical protein RFI_25984 [Reticulomyxa filosa]|eukprot:ETO11392.1 hypothetical protein RFI_25984 [Reticulomyxa filosa]
MDIASKTVKVHDEILNIQLWDIAGQDRFIALAPGGGNKNKKTYYRNALGAIVVFDATNKESLEKALKWKEHLDDKVCLKNGDHIPAVLFANKVFLFRFWDLIDANPEMQSVTDEVLHEMIEGHNFINWYPTSAKSELNVKKGINSLIQHIVRNTKNGKDQGDSRSRVDLQASVDNPKNDRCGACAR